MMYDELIKRLRYAADTEAKNHPTWNELMKQAADAIEELTAINERQLLEIAVLSKPRWIPVTERLPEGDANVLLCYEWTGRSGTIYREVGITSIPEIVNDPTEMLRPLYWMPLPEPPKDGEE